VLELRPEHVASAPCSTASLFGINEAVELARALEPGATPATVRLVLVTVGRPGPLARV